MNNPIKVEVPIVRYLKKYVYAHEQLPYDSPIDTSKGGHIITPLTLLFTGKTDLRWQETSIKGEYDYMPILLPWRNLERSQVVITPERVSFYNSFLYKSFLDQLLLKVMVGRVAKITEADTIRNEMAELDIVDDIDYDTIKKAIYRLKIRRKIPSFYDRNCPAA